jgi:hypothetical protein
MAEVQRSHHALIYFELLAQCLIARSARADRALKPLPSSLTHRRRACLFVRPSRTAARDPGRGGSAAVVVARRGRNASARSSSVRRRAIPDARSSGLLYEIRHICKKTRRNLARSACASLLIRYCCRSVHRLKSKRGPPAADNQRLVLRQRQDSGNLSSYEEILECPARRRSIRLRVAS